MTTTKKDIGIEGVGKDDTVIMICGPPGAGKSTLVEKLTGLDDLANDGVEQGTPEIRYHRTLEPREGKPIVFIDTPGDVSAAQNDAQHTEFIAKQKGCLTKIHKIGILNICIIFVYPLHEIRFDRSAEMSLSLFRELRKHAEGSRDAIVVARWDELEITNNCEEQRKEKFWNKLIEEGVSYHLLESSTPKAAWAIIDKILDIDEQTPQTNVGDTKHSTLGENGNGGPRDSLAQQGAEKLDASIICEPGESLRSSHDAVFAAQPTRQVELDQLQRDAPIFLVLGEVGTGKSSLVERLTGETNLVGHGLFRETSSVQLFKVNRPGQSIVLVDTPGFNGITQTDGDTKVLIDVCLQRLRSRQIEIRGLLLLHNIQRSCPSYELLDYLKSMRENQYYRGPITLVTTVWNQVVIRPAVRDRRQEVLKEILSTRGLGHGLRCMGVGQLDVEACRVILGQNGIRGREAPSNHLPHVLFPNPVRPPGDTLPNTEAVDHGPTPPSVINPPRGRAPLGESKAPDKVASSDLEGVRISSCRRWLERCKLAIKKIADKLFRRNQT